MQNVQKLPNKETKETCENYEKDAKKLDSPTRGERREEEGRVIASSVFINRVIRETNERWITTSEYGGHAMGSHCLGRV